MIAKVGLALQSSATQIAPSPFLPFAPLRVPPLRVAPSPLRLINSIKYSDGELAQTIGVGDHFGVHDLVSDYREFQNAE